MSNSIRGTNGKSPIQYTRQKSDASTPASNVILIELAPYEVVWCMLLWHGCNYYNGYKASNYNQEQPNVIQHRQDSVSKNDECAARPCYQHKGDVDVPWLDDQIWMENSVHLHDDIRGDRDDRG